MSRPSPDLASFTICSISPAPAGPAAAPARDLQPAPRRSPNRMPKAPRCALAPRWFDHPTDAALPPAESAEPAKTLAPRCPRRSATVQATDGRHRAIPQNCRTNPQPRPIDRAVGVHLSAQLPTSTTLTTANAEGMGFELMWQGGPCQAVFKKNAHPHTNCTFAKQSQTSPRIRRATRCASRCPPDQLVPRRSRTEPTARKPGFPRSTGIRTRRSKSACH